MSQEANRELTEKSRILRYGPELGLALNKYIAEPRGGMGYPSAILKETLVRRIADCFTSNNLDNNIKAVNSLFEVILHESQIAQSLAASKSMHRRIKSR